MLTVSFTEPMRRPWYRFFQRRRHIVALPTAWDDVHATSRRREWWGAIIRHGEAAAQRRALQESLRPLPLHVRRLVPPEEQAAMLQALSFLKADPDCAHVPISQFRHRGKTYAMPAPKGANTTCVEFAIADRYYTNFLEKKDAKALHFLVATICRELDTDQAAALRRGDTRVPLFDTAEVEARAQHLQKLPDALQIQALLYFGGLKAYIHRLYGAWLFDDEDDDPGSDQEAAQRGTQSPRRGPDFGWWGIFQSVAESGVFGDLRSVYQTPLHEVCIFLVRKKQEADTMRAAARSHSKPAGYEE